MNQPTPTAVSEVIYARTIGCPEHAYAIAARNEVSMVAMFAAVGEELERQRRIRDENQRRDSRWR